SRLHRSVLRGTPYGRRAIDDPRVGHPARECGRRGSLSPRGVVLKSRTSTRGHPPGESHTSDKRRGRRFLSQVQTYDPERYGNFHSAKSNQRPTELQLAPEEKTARRTQ